MAFIVTVRGVKRKVIYFLVLTLLGGLFVLRYAPQRYIDRIYELTAPSHDHTGSAQIRGENMLISVNYIRSHLFSEYGPGNNGYMIATEKGAIATGTDRSEHFGGQHVHSIFLQLGADMGSIALFFYSLFIFGNFYLVVKSRKYFHSEDYRVDELRYLRIAVMISFVGFISAGTFLPIAYRLYTYYIMGICAGFYNMTIRRYWDINNTISS